MSKSTTGRQMLEALEKRVSTIELRLDQLIATLVAPASDEDSDQMPHKPRRDA